MARSQDNKNIEPIMTTLGKETVFKGTMKFTKSLRVAGYFEGDIESTGFLFVEDGATIKANIKVRSVVVGGMVYGNITATEKLEMLSTGQVFGNIQTARLKIADGVVFEGKCEMIKSPEEVDIFSAPPDKIKNFVTTL